MRISLLYNEGAGHGVALRTLREALERGGHELVQTIEKNSGLESVLESTEVIVAAGGDGTVSTAARAVAGRDIPVAILPLGTANNIARSLGIEGSIPHLIGSWSSARRRAVDLGVASGSWGRSRFLEAVGGGLIPAGIAAMGGQPGDGRDEDRRARLARAARKYRDALSGLRAYRWTLTLDGTRQDGELLVLEVLNIRSVGPNLVLSPDVDCSDGFFSVVTAGEEHREDLADYLRHRIEGKESRLCLPSWRARQIEIQGTQAMHVDDEVHGELAIGTVFIQIERAAVQFLT